MYNYILSWDCCSFACTINILVQMRVSSAHDFVQKYEERRRLAQLKLAEKKNTKRKSASLRHSLNSKNYDSYYS
jgi:hypothetical protein